MTDSSDSDSLILDSKPLQTSIDGPRCPSSLARVWLLLELHDVHWLCNLNETVKGQVPE